MKSFARSEQGLEPRHLCRPQLSAQSIDFRMLKEGSQLLRALRADPGLALPVGYAALRQGLPVGVQRQIAIAGQAECA